MAPGLRRRLAGRIYYDWVVVGACLVGAAPVAFAVTGLLAPPLAGFRFEAVGSYAPAFRAFGALGVVGAGCPARCATDA